MNKSKILVIEDELNLREAICEYFTIENYEVTSAENGQEALDILNYWIPDLILCDIAMPVMDGQMLYEILMQNNTLNAIPFIFLTANNDNNVRKKCIIDGADEFISKPFKFIELSEIVNSKIKKFERIKNSYNNIYTGSKNIFLHEINTPLKGIMESIRLLIENEEDININERLPFYEAIKISGKRLNRAMLNLMLYQNIKNNTIEFDKEAECDLLDCISEVKKEIQVFHKNLKRRIHLDITPEKLKISSNYLELILYELIDNALKFSNKNKKISVTGHKYNDEFYELTITDYGDGFSPEEIKEIQATKQFNREKKEQQGLGLGLFISKTIVLQSNGLFSIDSKKDQNTTVKIFLPLSY